VRAHVRDERCHNDPSIAELPSKKKPRRKAAVVPRKTVNADNGSSVTRAFQALRELIVRGNLPPGAWIIEAEIAERLSLSRTPIRGALQWLHREGYVVEHKGTRKARIIVAPLTRDDARELYLIVGHLERLAGTLVVALSASERTALASELASLNDELNEIASQRPVDPRRVFDLDEAFHTRIIEASGGRRLTTLYKSVRPQVERYWRLYASSIINELHMSVAEHNDIVRAIRKGDGAAIQVAIDRNWTGGFERISRLIEIFGERGSW
jgi:DNA-binding GntR family transcriptional regulator